VQAFECVPHMAALAKTLCSVNQLPAVEVVCGHSESLDPARLVRADVLVAELLDTPGIGEGLLSGHRHAHRHLLAEGGFSIPSRVVLHAMLVESELLRASRVLERGRGAKEGEEHCAGRGTW
jgi:predicted RNA methylase